MAEYQPEKKRIGELLIENGYISPEQLEEALEIQKTKRQRICNILIDLGYLTEQSFSEFLSKISGIASIQLSNYEMQRDILDLIPRELAVRLEAIPIGKIGSLLTVAMVCPLDEAGRTELENTTGLRIRPVLCSRTAVYGAIDRYYEIPEETDQKYEVSDELSALEASLKLGGVAKLVEEIEELPTLPDILSVIASVVNDPTSSAADLAKVIASDSSLSAKILKFANSAAFGFSRKISNIQDAVTLLGFKETQELALSASVLDYLVDMAALDFKAYWNHSFTCATLTRLIALNLKSRETESTFVAGLLHDVGKLVLAMGMRDKQEQVNSLCSTDNMTRLEAEEKVLGLNHAEAGYLLGEHWLLPSTLTNAIRYHHIPELEPEPRSLAAIIFLANIFSKMDVSTLEANMVFPDSVLDVLQTLQIPETIVRTTIDIYSGIASDITVF
jgi:HD-like signal output (HDOD) protein